MRYTAMIVGFLLATLTAVGAAEPDRPDHVAFTVHDLVKTKTFHSTVFGWTFAIRMATKSLPGRRTSGGTVS